MPTNRRWGDAETARARELFVELKSYRAVARTMGWGESTVREHMQGRVGIGWGHSHLASVGGPAAIYIPAWVYARRDKLAGLKHADLTAVLMGDPPVGRAALISGE